MIDKLTGWCVLFIRDGNTYPSMVCNISSRKMAKSQADHIITDGGEIIAICRESDLRLLNADMESPK